MSNKASLKLSPDGDLSSEAFRSRSGLLQGREAVKQELKILLKTIRGEDPFDEQHGFRVFEVTTRPIAVLEREVKLALRSDDRVQRVVSCECPNDPASDTGVVQANRTVQIRVVVELSDFQSPMTMEAQL